MQQTRKKKHRVFKFRKNTDGATAIEFTILAIPFFALVFGIIELALVFFLTSTTEHAVATVSREIRTGEFQATGGGAEQFKDEICKAMAAVGDCKNLRIDVISADSGRFTDLALPVSPKPCAQTDEQCQDQEPILPPDDYDQTAGGDVVIVRVQYIHKLAFPSALTGLANGPGNTRIINAVTAFRNEPFS